MTLVFLFTFAIGNVWGAVPDYESYDWSSSDAMTAGLAGNTSVTISVVTGGSDGNVSGHWYKALNSAIDGSATGLGTHLTISSASQIDSVEIFFCPNGTNNTNLAWAGWGESVTPSAEVGTNYGSTASVKSSKSWANAVWEKIDLSSKEIYTLYISRQGKKLTNSGTNIDNFGGGQTVNLLGLRVWLHKHTVTLNPNGGGYTSTPEGWTASAGKYTKAVLAGSLALPEPAYAGNTFAGWKNKNNEDVASPITVSKDTVLTAQWTPTGGTTHNITYNEASLKGQSVSGYPTEYYEGTGIASFAALADVTDFHFNGWSPASINDTEDQDVEVFATWVAAYNVTFSAGAGSGTVPTTFQKWNGATFNLPGQGSMTAPSGKAFDGWKANGTGDKLAAGAEYTMGAAAVQFVAQWKAVPTVLFHYQQSNLSSNLAAGTYTATGGTITTSAEMSKESAAYNAAVATDMKGGANVGKLGSTAAYIQLTLTTGNFLEGDTVYICGYKPYMISTSSSVNGDIASSITTGTAKGDYNVGYAIIPTGVEQNSIYLSRAEGSGTGFAAVKVIRPAEKEVKSTVNTLTDVKVNGTSIAAGDLATLVSTHSLALDDAEATAPTITFNKHTVITYVDDTQKVTDTPIEETAADNGAGKWAASTTIDAVTYTVTLNIATGYHVTYKANGGDGTMTDANLYAAGDEVTVLDNAFTAPAANKKFNGWTSSPVVTISGEGKFEMPASDVELSAVWTEFFTITYKDGDETLDTEDVFVGGTPAGLSPAPTKPLYVFGGWVNNVDEDVNITTIATTTTVYVKWNKLYVPQGANYVFENTATVGTAPNAITVTKDNKKNSIAANSRIDNMWLSAMDVYLEDGTYDGGDDDFKGWKIKTASATIKFFVESDCRVTVTTGTLSSGMNITYTGKSATEAATTALTAKQANSFDIKGGTLVTLTTAGGSTVTLKGIAVSEIPAVSDDATLSDLTLKYGEEAAATITGFNSGKYIYNVVMPYGTTKAELPIVGATATQGAKSLVTINQAKDREDWKTVIRVQAEDRVDEHDKYYEVRFIVEPKQGVSIIKATTQKVVTGYIGGTAVLTKDGSAQSGNTYKLDSKVTFGITLADSKTFKEGDVFVMNITVAPGSATSMGTMKVYDAADATEPIYETAEVGSVGVNYWTLPAAAEGKTSLYIKRGNGDDWNPTFSYVEVRRLMAPVIKSFKIGEEVGAINESAKTIAVEVPYGTAVNALTPEIEYYGNGDGAIDKTGPQDFTNPVEYTVSSAYAEDATGDYAPVTYTVTVTVADHYEAKIGDVGYATLVEAVAAAVDGDVIVLQENVTAGAGVMIAKADAKQITIDFGGFTYKAVSPGVGSVGTQNQAFHFEKGCDITLKNGTITSEGNAIIMLVQNYGDLTLENITLDGSGLEGSHRYVMSNNCGDVVIGDGATITAKTGDVAFDVCATNYYPEGVTVTVKDGATISGIVEYDVWGTKPADNKAELAIEGGTLNITWNVESALAEDAKANLNVSGGVFNAAVPEDYCAEGYAPYQIAAGKYGVQYEGVIRAVAAQMAAHGNAYAVTLDNGIVVISSNSDGKFDSSNQFDNSAADAAVALGADEGKYRYKGQHILLNFPKNVKEFTIYSYDNNTTDRTINKVTFGGDPSVDKLKNLDAVGTYTFTNNTTTKLRTMTATMGDAEIIPAGEYVYVGLSNAHTVFRILFTEAECTDPVINSTNAIRAKVGEEATVSVDASAIGASYTWYRCDDELGANPQPITGATKASYKFTKAAGNEYFKVVVGCNCSVETDEAIITAEEWYQVDRVNVTGYTEWNWAGVYDDATAGPQINQAQKGLVLASYIDAPNFNKLEGNNNAYVYRKNQYPAYQGTSLKFTTEIPGMLIIDASYQDSGNEITVNGNNLGALPKNHAADFKIAVPAGDVTITSAGMRIWAMKFDPDFSNYAVAANHFNGYTRDVTEGRYGTICLPNGGIMVGAELYEVAYYDGTYEKIFLDEVLNGEMVAGRPYIFLTKEGVDKIAVFYTDEANAPEGDYHGLFGSYSKIHLAPNDHIYILKDNRYYFVDTDNVFCGANRAYFKMGVAGGISGSYAAPAPGRRRMSIGAGAPKLPTGIENTGFESEAPRKLLINGELYIIRGEKMYDAKGQLVK